jgi:hypothetical protein
MTRQLIAKVEQLWREARTARADALASAAVILASRLSALGTYGADGCPTCPDAEARAFLARLHREAMGEGSCHG